jgi:hypothetical protein
MAGVKRTDDPRPAKIFGMVDGGVPVERAANVMHLPISTAWRLLKQEEDRLGRRANAAKRRAPRKMGGHNKGQKMKPRPGTYGETFQEALARLAPLMRQVTEAHSRRGA